MKNSRGMSLIVVVVLGTLMLLIVKGMMDLSLNAFRSSRQLSERSDRETIRNLVRMKLDCGETLTATPTCTDGSLINLLDRNGAAVLPPKFGKYDVQAKCTAVAKTYRVEYRDPSNMDWRDLFKDSPPLICP